MRNIDFDPRQFVDRETMRKLMQRNDRPALFRFSIQILLFAALLFIFASFEMPPLLFGVLILVFGFVFFSLYAPLHETSHGTAFRNDRLNLIVGWITGILYGYSPGLHEDFHFTHHRHTNKEKDPEKGFSLPEMPGKSIFSGLAIGLLGSLAPLHSIALSIAPTSAWDKMEAAWADPRHRKTLQWESRIVALCWVTTLVLLAVFSPGMLWVLIFGLVIGRVIHGFVSFSEHDGMAEEGQMIFRSRSVVSNAFFRFFWWNMNYHAEHHTWPSVPYHQLPELHGIISEDIVETEASYLDFFSKDRSRKTVPAS